MLERKKIEESIPHVKSMKDYPAVLVARLGVDKKYASQGIGSDVLNFIKVWFLDPMNKTGCRFILIDAYNTPSTLSFYSRNGFSLVFSTEEQEKSYRTISQNKELNTRLMFCDLMKVAQGEY